MGTAGSSETPVHTYHSTRCHIPQDYNLQSHYDKNFKLQLPPFSYIYLPIGMFYNKKRDWQQTTLHIIKTLPKPNTKCFTKRRYCANYVNI
jgi:hypothetical protein